MKKFLSIFVLLAIFSLAFVTVSCEDDNDGQKITEQNLPQNAQTFLATFFPAQSVSSVVREHENGVMIYEVKYYSGFSVEFDSEGNWTDVDAPDGKEIPMGIAPDAIANYVNDNYPATPINEISRKTTGYEVELTSGLDLYFDASGNFIKAEK